MNPGDGFIVEFLEFCGKVTWKCFSRFSMSNIDRVVIYTFVPPFLMRALNAGSESRN